MKIFTDSPCPFQVCLTLVSTNWTKFTNFVTINWEKWTIDC